MMSRYPFLSTSITDILNARVHSMLLLAIDTIHTSQLGYPDYTVKALFANPTLLDYNMALAWLGNFHWRSQPG